MTWRENKTGEGGRYHTKKEEQDWRMIQLPNGSGWSWRMDEER